MAASPSWFSWLAGLVSGVWSGPAAPGSHEALLEESRAGALLNKELRKPTGQRDEELVRTLCVEYLRRQLSNLQAKAHTQFCWIAARERPAGRECCAAAEWVRLRSAASHRARHNYYCQHVEQVKEELAAARERRPAVIVAEPALHLNLPAALQQQPPRLDMCSACAQLIEQMEQAEESLKLQEDFIRKQNKRRGLQPAAAAAAAASQEAAGPASAAADLAAGQAQQQRGQQQQEAQQQQGQQQEQGQQHSGGSSVDGGTEPAPATPTHRATVPTQQRPTSDQEQEHWQH